MQVATIIIFLALSISAPWIARKWGNRGALSWMLASAVFVITALLVLE
jgi:hypothetical protein